MYTQWVYVLTGAGRVICVVSDPLDARDFLPADAKLLFFDLANNYVRGGVVAAYSSEICGNFNVTAYPVF